MSIDNHLITKFIDINLIEIEESKPLLENQEFKKGIFHLFFEHRYLSWYIRYTYEQFRTYRKHYDRVNCVSDF